MDTLAKTVLITGCSSGIGRSTAIHFARLDWQVIATVRHQDDADKLMMLGYTNIQAELLDLDDENQILEFVRKIKDQNKDSGLDVLVNNAGIAEACPIEFASTEHLQQHFSTNVIAPMVMIKACMPMLKKNQGVIVNISSGLNQLSIPLMGVYSASKSAINTLSETLRIEIRQSGVNVIVIEPGFIDTPLQNKISHSYGNITNVLPGDCSHYYQLAVEKSLQLQNRLKKNATKPSKVAQVITKAVIQDQPKPRYVVGYDAKLLSWVEPTMPILMKDQLWRLLFKY